MSNIFVDVSTRNPNYLTEEHLARMNELIKCEDYPERYCPPVSALTFTKRVILPRHLIVSDRNCAETPRVQNARTGGSQTEKNEQVLFDSYVKHGYDLRELPPAVVKVGEEYRYLTGHTRDAVATKLAIDYIIVDLFEPVEGATMSEVEGAISFLGVYFNPERLPAFKATMDDIQSELERAVTNGWIERDITAVSERANFLGKAVNLSQTKIDMLTLRVLNSQGEDLVARPMSSAFASSWMEEFKYINIPHKVKYFTRSYDVVTKPLCDATKYANEHPDEEVRVVIHAGVLDDFENQTAQYYNRISGFVTKWNDLISAFSSVHFGGKRRVLSNIKLYGAVPQVGRFQDLTRVIPIEQVMAEAELVAEEELAKQRERTEDFLTNAA